MRGRTPPATRRPPVRLLSLVALLAVLPFLGGCENPLDVENEQDIGEADLDQEAALDPVVNGVAGDFAAMYADAINIIGLVSFELIHTGSFPSWRSVETGLMDRTSNGNGVYNDIARAMWVADDAARRIDETFDGSRQMIQAAQVRTWGGFAKIMMADNFCQGTIDGGPARPPEDFYQMAVESFTEAVQIAGASSDTDAADWVRLATLGRARARLMLGDHPGARTDAAAIPSGYEFEVIYSNNSGREQNSVASLTRTLTRREAGVHPHFYEDARFIADPRTPFIDRGPNETGPDPTRKYVEQEKYKREDDPIPLATWQEARLMEAEVEIEIGSLERAVELIDEVRGYRDLEPYGGELTRTAVTEQLFYERSAELWLQGHRLNDLRRAGSPMLEGRDECFEIGIDEWESNPNLGN